MLLPFQMKKVTFLNPVIKQNNWTNLFLQTIGNQLNRIEDNLSKINTSKSSPSKSYLDLQQPDIKSNFPVSGFKLTNSQDSEFADLLVERLKGLNLNVLHKGNESEFGQQPQSQTDTDTDQHIHNVEACLHKIEYDPLDDILLVRDDLLTWFGANVTCYSLLLVEVQHLDQSIL